MSSIWECDDISDLHGSSLAGWLAYEQPAHLFPVYDAVLIESELVNFRKPRRYYHDKEALIEAWLNIMTAVSERDGGFAGLPLQVRRFVRERYAWLSERCRDIEEDDFDDLGEDAIGIESTVDTQELYQLRDLVTQLLCCTSRSFLFPGPCEFLDQIKRHSEIASLCAAYAFKDRHAGYVHQLREVDAWISKNHWSFAYLESLNARIMALPDEERRIGSVERPEDGTFHDDLIAANSITERVLIDVPDWREWAQQVMQSAAASQSC